MDIQTVPLNPTTSYEGKACLYNNLGGNRSTITMNVTFRTDASANVCDFKSGIPGSSLTPQDVSIILVINKVNGQKQDLRFHESARRGELSMAYEALKEGGDINLKLKQNSTPLHWAAAFKNTNVAKWLVENGADPDPVDSLGWTPLFLAAKEGNDELIDLLVAKGAKTERIINGQSVSLGPKAATPTKESVMKDILARAGGDGRILSDHREEHFQKIVPAMDFVEAVRQGSREDVVSGRKYIFDIYILPNRMTIHAGYPR